MGGGFDAGGDAAHGAKVGFEDGGEGSETFAASTQVLPESEKTRHAVEGIHMDVSHIYAGLRRAAASLFSVASQKKKELIQKGDATLWDVLDASSTFAVATELYKLARLDEAENQGHTTHSDFTKILSPEEKKPNQPTFDNLLEAGPWTADAQKSGGGAENAKDEAKDASAPLNPDAMEDLNSAEGISATGPLNLDVGWSQFLALLALIRDRSSGEWQRGTPVDVTDALNLELDYRAIDPITTQRRDDRERAARETTRALSTAMTMDRFQRGNPTTRLQRHPSTIKTGRNTKVLLKHRRRRRVQ